jgi:hypothetical protein
LYGLRLKFLLGALGSFLVLPLLETRFTLRYIYTWLILVGSTGLLSIIGNYLEPLLGNRKFLMVEGKTAFIAVIIYLMCLFVGLIALRFGRVKVTRLLVGFLSNGAQAVVDWTSAGRGR